MCFFQVPGLQGNQSLCWESQPALFFLPESSFVVASFASSNWSLAIKCLGKRERNKTVQTVVDPQGGKGELTSHSGGRRSAPKQNCSWTPHAFTDTEQQGMCQLPLFILVLVLSHHRVTKNIINILPWENLLRTSLSCPEVAYVFSVQ